MPVVEDDFAASGREAVAALLHAEEAGDEVEGRRTDVAGEVWEEAEKEAGGAVQEDDLGAVIEIGVLGNGLLVTLAHEGDHVRKVEIATDGFVHHVEEGGVEGVVVGLLEEEIAAGQGGVGFEFLRGLVRTLVGRVGERRVGAYIVCVNAKLFSKDRPHGRCTVSGIAPYRHLGGDGIAC